MADKRPAVFLDRDGTLMREVHYCRDPRDVSIYEGVSEALDRLHAAGFVNVIVTNQSGVGRGLITLAEYHAVHAELLRQIGPDRINATYFCPDAPGNDTPRRKPAPGMVLEAAADLGLDLARSWFVGDKPADIECGRRAGTRTILVQTGYGAETEAALEPDVTAAGVVEAIKAILEISARAPGS